MNVRISVWLAVLLAVLPAGAAAQPRPVVIGTAVPLTGYLADLGVGLRNGLLLWQEQVNAAGGLLGRQVALKLYDDGSETERSTPLYELLIKDDSAEVLIGPLGSAATSIAAAVAERGRRVMVNASGVSPSIHKRLYRYVFQVPPPSDTTASGVLPFAARHGLKSAMVVARDEGAAAALVEQLKAGASGAKVELRPNSYYAVDALGGLAPFAEKLKGSGVDAVVTHANPRDSADLVRGFKAAGYRPKLFVAHGAVEADFIKRVGMDAEYTVAFSVYEPLAATPGNATFVKAYRATHKAAPDFHAACGWAAGKVVEAAVAKAGSFDQEALRAALAGLETDTLFGAYKVSADGAQTAARPLLVQILKGRREVVWPEAWRSAEPVVPAPEWERNPVK